MTTDSLLNLSKVTEPFDLKTALKYMEENGEFIRFKNDLQDFYIYQSTETRPAIVNGKRQFIELTSVRAFDKWLTPITAFDLSQLLETAFYIMRFDEHGEPIWDVPQASPDEQG